MYMLRKVQYIKAWCEQSANAVTCAASSAIVPLWLVGLENLGENPSYASIMVTNALPLMAAVVVSAFWSTYKENLVDKHHKLFENRGAAKKVLVEASAVMTYVDPVHGGEALEQALRRFEENASWHSLKSISLNQRKPHFATSFTAWSSGSNEAMIKADADGLQGILGEALHLYVTNKSYEYMVSENSNIKHAALTTSAETYIVENHPDLVLLDPLLFSDHALDTYTPGLSRVVQALRALSMSRDEIRIAIDTWRQREVAADVTDKNLPPDLAI